MPGNDVPRGTNAKLGTGSFGATSIGSYPSLVTRQRIRPSGYRLPTGVVPKGIQPSSVPEYVRNATSAPGGSLVTANGRVTPFHASPTCGSSGASFNAVCARR